jgi:hypothetical protein
MSSVSRSNAAIPLGNGFFITINSPINKVFTQATLDAYSGAITVENLGSVVNVTSGNATTGAKALNTALIAANGGVSTAISGQFGANKIVKDLGKTLYLQQNGQNVIIYKYVTIVFNVTGEGAYPTASVSGEDSDNGFYLPVWSADSTLLVPVVRTGY